MKGITQYECFPLNFLIGLDTLINAELLKKEAYLLLREIEKLFLFVSF
jgi:hypothetical protein